MAAQVLDSMDLERERGITIKSHPIRMNYARPSRRDVGAQPDRHAGPRRLPLRGQSRSLAACEGALLVVDAVQGVQAQTINNLYLALEHDLTILPVINKIDLAGRAHGLRHRPVHRPDGLRSRRDHQGQRQDRRGRRRTARARSVERVPAPSGRSRTAPAQGAHLRLGLRPLRRRRGLRAHVRRHHRKGRDRSSSSARATATTRSRSSAGSGWRACRRSSLTAGEVGYIATGAKDVRHVRVGDTITLAETAAAPRPCPATPSSSRWSSAASTRPRTTTTTTCSTRCRSCS